MRLPSLSERLILHLDANGDAIERRAPVIIEEPLEIRLHDQPIAVLMRTPGHDMELALGFLFSEGVLRSPDQVLAAHHCDDVEQGARGNIVNVRAEGADPGAVEQARRAVYVSSSCGICGKASIDTVRLLVPPIEPIGPLRHTVLARLPARLRQGQDLFSATGGLHAAGLFSQEGELLLLREDVGRHNACDKVLGACVQQDRWPLGGRLMVLSGRVSFEMVQKAAMAGIGAIVAISAPSSLAIDFASELGITLVGFARGGAMNLYCGELLSA